jgi:hypothetical protein
MFHFVDDSRDTVARATFSEETKYLSDRTQSKDIYTAKFSIHVYFMFYT